MPFRVVGMFTAALLAICIAPGVSAAQDTTLGQDANAQLANTLDALKESQAQQKRLLEELSKKIAEPKKNPWTEATTLVVPLLVALGGWFFAAYQAYQTRADQRAARRSQATEAQTARTEQHLFASLDWFSGQTQRRSIGIAVVKANWDKFEHLQPTWLSLLVSQAIYLLTESEAHRKSHELANLENIMARLLASLEKWNQIARISSAINANRRMR